MSDKPASMYRDIDKPAYTRREYITGIPGSKVAQYKMGDIDADRVSDGMRQSFGKIVGTAARIGKGERLFTVWCNPEDAHIAKDAFRRAYNKISPPCTVKVERGEELLIA